MLIKKEQVRPERPVILLLYGVPGSGKTSVATTSNNPVLIDTDRGSDRAIRTIDTVLANSWDDVIGDLPTIRTYNTIIVDTAKAALDDYVKQYVIQRNYKLASNNLKCFGEMADNFKTFVNTLRTSGADIIFICHDKETQEGDIIKHAPSCTGQSKDLLLQISDQVGYVSIINGKRVISFGKADNYVTKDTAQLFNVEIPDETEAEFSTCMSNIIKNVKKAIQSHSEAQKAAAEAIESANKKLLDADSLDKANELIGICKTLPTKAHQSNFWKTAVTAMALKGFTFDKKAKKFVKDEATDKSNSN